MTQLAFRWTYLGSILALGLFFAGIPQAHAQTKDFSVSVQSAITGIPEFARQAGIQMLVSEKLVRGKQTAAVTGSHSIDEAVAILLNGTGLTASTKDGGTYTVVAAPPPKGSDGSIVFNIPAEALDAALKDFSTQSGIVVTAEKEITAGKTSNGARGTMKVSEALRRVLKRSGLTFVLGSDGVFTVQANAIEGPTQEKTDTADVTVEGQQEKEKPYSGMNVDIPRTINDVQPYYIFDSATIDQSGAENIEDFLKQRLTMNTSYVSASQVYGNPTLQGATVPNVAGATTSSINLRGLGTDHTLILVDGRRMAGVSFQGTTSQPDINGIPLAAIDRIEVLPSSASGIYGGSAVGGVINIILKRNYQGGEIRVSYDKPSHSSASNPSVDGTYGFSLENGKTHVMLSAHYSDADPLVTGDRADLIERGLGTILKNCPSCLYFTGQYGQPFLGGTTPNIFGHDSSYNPQNLILANGTVFPSPYAHIAPGCTSSTPLISCLAPGFNFNLSPGYGPYGLAQPLGSFATVTSFDVTLNRQMNPWLNAFAEIRLEENVGRTQFSPYAANNQATFGSGSSGYVPGVTPFQNAVVDYSLPATTTAQARAYSASRSATTGVTATLPGDWSAEMDYTWSKNELSTDSSIFDQNSFISAVQNGTIDPFVDSIKYPLSLSQFLLADPTESSTTLNDLTLRGIGPIARLPGGKVTLAFGVDYEWDKTPQSSYHNSSGIGQPSEESLYLPQSESTTSLYVEGTVPIISSLNSVWGLRSLELQLTDRIDRYSVLAGTTEERIYPFPNTQGSEGIVYTPTPPDANPDGTGGTANQFATSYRSNNQTLGLKYKPIDDVTFRVSRATAFLPPTYSQLLPNPVVNIGGDTITDPKSGQTYQVNTINGGNPGLKPQSSLSWDLGLIYEPVEGVLKGLRVDLEYYDIAQFGVITSPNGNEILSSPTFAGRVTRNAAGIITQINESLINAPVFRTEGLDLSLDYRKSTSIGTFDWHSAATKINLEDRQYDIGGSTADYVGWSDEGGETRYKVNGGLTWNFRHWTVGWNTNWYSGYHVNQTAGDPIQVNAQSVNFMEQGSDHIPSQMYHQLQASYALGKDVYALNGLFANVTFRLVVDNVFNTLPPLDVVQLPFYYSPYGNIDLRTFHLALKKSF